MVLLWAVPACWGFQGGVPLSVRCSGAHGASARLQLSMAMIDRRAVIAGGIAAFPGAVLAVSDTTARKFSTQAPPTDKDKEPFTYFESGVGYREYVAGKGEAQVEEGSRVTINCVGRLLNLNGVKFFSTKETTDEFGEGTPLTFTIGAGEALPGLEEGMLGMRKGAIRKVSGECTSLTPATSTGLAPCEIRHSVCADSPLPQFPLPRAKQVLVPPSVGYSAGDDLLPQPRKGPGQGRAALDSVLKNPRRDASLLFEVKLEAIK